MVLRVAANVGTTVSDVNFISNYGSISKDYSCVSSLGRASARVVFSGIGSIFFGILSLVFFIMKYGINNNSLEQVVQENTNFTNFKENIAPILAYICLGLCILCGGLWFYFYLFCYLKQYPTWAAKIPASALAQRNATQTVENILNATRRRRK